MHLTFLLALLLACALGALAAHAGESSLVNPTGRAYTDEVVRLKTPFAGDPKGLVVKEDGAEVASQVEPIGGKNWIWVCSTFAPGQTHKYTVEAGQPQAFPPKVTLRKEGGVYLLDNGVVAVKVPAEAGAGIPGPLAAFRLPGDKWAGGSFWKTGLALTKFTATEIGNGTVLAKVRLRYEFDGKAGLEGDIPAFAEVEVALGPGWDHVEFFERHEMAHGDYWEAELSRGWAPNEGRSEPFCAGPGSGSVEHVPPHIRPLKPGAVPYAEAELFLNMFPRWNQHFKDGWFFAATDGQAAAGAVVVKASRWIWPHFNSLRAVVKESGVYAGLRGPTLRGQRLWWLRAGAADTAGKGDIGYVIQHGFEDLDKLNHDFILDWPGKKPGFYSMNPYDSGQINPTGFMRQEGRSATANAGKPGDTGTLLKCQVRLHDDTYGSYWNFWSPENPNFFSDYIRVPVSLTTNLKDHPQFAQLAQWARLRVREDVYHSVTLPGGAGQECPGYMHTGGWVAFAALCKEHLGLDDPFIWERVKAAEHFRNRISQPDGEVRRILPMGDTHPTKDGPRQMDVPPDEVKMFATEELPGFGVIFNSKPGTPEETYLSFKSGPNRGHYHGDQLSVVFSPHARPAAVDHWCSYHPRAGQEHMHNRVAFSTEDWPYTNMDGYERLIALKTSADADIAMGQVESERLRKVEKLPPEMWHQEYPQLKLNPQLCYRRTVVFMKNAPQNYVVLRDQYWAPVPLKATYCLHVHSDNIKQDGQAVRFGNLTLFCAEPTHTEFESFPWQHSNGKLESTQGARLTVKGDVGEFITVLCPGETLGLSTIPGGVKVGDDEITFAGNRPTAGDAATYVTVKRGGKEILTLKGQDLNLDRFQGEVGLFVPDAGYPFGEMPDWLLRQRVKKPAWYGELNQLAHPDQAK